ncbi:MAG: amine dehydrogenase large subunit [Pseudomonadota bacterium]
MPQFRTVFLIASSFITSQVCAQDAPPALAPEPLGIIETLPAQYPENWFIVHDASFFHMSDGKVYILDVTAKTLGEQFKGMFNSSLIGNLAQSPARGEIYSTETFHTRGQRGDRIDLLTIWDSATLSPVGEVMLPKGKRFMGIPQRNAVTLINDGKWLAIANFSPATSATIVDLDSREILSEVGTPGCVMTYPTGPRGFSALCPDGRFFSTQLAEDGSVAQQERSEVFFDSDTTPIFDRAATIDGIAYFPSFAGLIHPVDLRGAVASVGEAWPMATGEEAAENWAPSGVAIIDKDDLGRFYLLMHSGAADGTHGGGGPEVWVFDPATKSRVQRIALQSWGLSIAVSRGSEPLLLVTNPEAMSLEVYDARSGEFQQTITGFGQETPLLATGAQ